MIEVDTWFEIYDLLAGMSIGAKEVDSFLFLQLSLDGERTETDKGNSAIPFHFISHDFNNSIKGFLGFSF